MGGKKKKATGQDSPRPADAIASVFKGVSTGQTPNDLSSSKSLQLIKRKETILETI